MAEIQFSPTPFDWLSELAPAFDAQESWLNGSYNRPELFHLVYKPNGPFAIACGAGLLAEHIRRFRFSVNVIQHMGQITDEHGRSVFQESFLNYLQRLQLRVQVNCAPEGALLLPGEPLLIVQGPVAQIQLMQSAFKKLIWESTHWATVSANARWAKGHWTEEDTPSPPVYPFNPDGWKIRAAYVGGASADEILQNVGKTTRNPSAEEGLKGINHASGVPMVQIRRLFRGNTPLGDVWLTQANEEVASVSKTRAKFTDETTNKATEIQMTRFQNLYQPVLVKGHPVLPPPRLGYLRQRMLKQTEAFHLADLEKYPHGWYL
ncbi:MAG: hypothetical protein H6565_14435 [Lewinellaceae bacterium]|nr:hypothetical protein [Saprospiraceae bacterium]MCB9307791.1 hypothetical protein [Lewinellaceae bacterium]MCB9356577.1 hypothetical protein [Lewinellaceae bacterium]